MPLWYSSQRRVNAVRSRTGSTIVSWLSGAKRCVQACVVALASLLLAAHDRVEEAQRLAHRTVEVARKAEPEPGEAVAFHFVGEEVHDGGVAEFGARTGYV